MPWKLDLCDSDERSQHHRCHQYQSSSINPLDCRSYTYLCTLQACDKVAKKQFQTWDTTTVKDFDFETVATSVWFFLLLKQPYGVNLSLRPGVSRIGYNHLIGHCTLQPSWFISFVNCSNCFLFRLIHLTRLETCNWIIGVLLTIVLRIFYRVSWRLAFNFAGRVCNRRTALLLASRGWS